MSYLSARFRPPGRLGRRSQQFPFQRIKNNKAQVVCWHDFTVTIQRKKVKRSKKRLDRVFLKKNKNASMAKL